MHKTSKKWVLVLSNLAYLFPVGVLSMKMLNKSRNKTTELSLISLLLFVTFFSSWSYHTCKAHFEHNQPRCDFVCPQNSMSWTNGIGGNPHSKMTFDLSKLLDHLFAMFTLLMVVIHVIPIAEGVRKFMIVISLIWMMMFLTNGNEILATLPALLAFLLLVSFWFVIRNEKSTKTYNRNAAWSIAMFLSMLAFTFYQVDTEPYWLKHSLWHILSGISAAFLMSKTAGCYEDVDTENIQIPNWMNKLFTHPSRCM